MTGQELLLDALKEHIERGLGDRVGQKSVTIDLKGLRPDESVKDRLREWLKEERGARGIQFTRAPRPSRVKISF
jgi:hypothetical protein